MIRQSMLGWKWLIQMLASKVFWDWEFIPLFGLDPYVLGISIWSWPRRVEEEVD